MMITTKNQQLIINHHPSMMIKSWMMIQTYIKLINKQQTITTNNTNRIFGAGNCGDETGF